MRTDSQIAPERIRRLTMGEVNTGPVVYWMTREHRVADNWPLLLAQKIGIEHKRPLIVVFCLVSDYPGANIRHYGFMLKGLQQVEENLKKLNIPFFLLQGAPPDILPRYLAKIKAAFLVTDFDPLRLKLAWQAGVAKGITCPFFVVDGHNIVPCWHVSAKQEYAAYTLRPKVKKVLPDFLNSFPKLKSHPFIRKELSLPPTEWPQIRDYVTDHSVKEIDWLKPGEAAAMAQVRSFLKKGLQSYSQKRNDPNLDGQSNISPYLHFGHIAPQRVALLVKAAEVPDQEKEAFLEELIVRRELADNFCYYNENYNSFAGFPDWARKTLDEHRSDKREFVYPLEIFEKAKTHDELWNTAQRQMMVQGKMPGYLRMYWAKKILEWTESPEEAVAIATYLNDRYELDGRDPNGYTGIAWSIGGVHDKAWRERQIFGKIRYMNYAGCARKFDVKKYISEWRDR